MWLSNLIEKRKFKKREKLYNDTPDNLYVICHWARWGVLPCKQVGWDGLGHPLIIEYNDHNGEYESYDIIPWDHCTSGCSPYWLTDRDAALLEAEELNKEEEKHMEELRNRLGVELGQRLEEWRNGKR